MMNLRRITGFTIILTLVLMTGALFQFRAAERDASSANHFEYDLNENWSVVTLGDSREALTDSRKLHRLVCDALQSGNSQEADLPYAGASDAGSVVAFRHILSEEYANVALSYTSTDTATGIFLDGELLYRYGFREDGTFEAHGVKEHMVDISGVSERGELWIVQVSSVPDAASTLGSVRLTLQGMVVVSGSIVDTVCCLLIVLMAFIMFALALIRLYTNQPSRGEAYLGLAGVAAGSYCFIGTDALNLIYNIQEAYVMQEYLVLTAVLSMALYFEQSLCGEHPRRFRLLLAYVTVNALSQIGLKILGVRAMADMTLFSAVAWGAVCLTALVSLVQLQKSGRFQVKVNILCLLILLAGQGFTVVCALVFNTFGDDVIEQYSMAVFSVIMAAAHILRISKEYRESAEAARHEALAANEAKGRFLANMSHEIRTPINAVLGMDEMILRETREPQIKEYAFDIYTAGQTLLSLINDILDFSRIESGKMEIVPVEYDISSMIHDLANMASQRAERKNISLEVAVDPQIPSRLYGDDVRIRQVLTNILTNAVKYTHEGTVWLRVRCRKDGDTAALTFEVEDTGIGIREEDLPKLYAEFERIEEDRNRNIEGTGLGMSITIQLLALMGSRLQVESVYGKGSAFYFELEQKIVDHTPVGNFESRIRQIAEHYDYRSKFCAPDAKILVVDDNAANRKVFRHLLKKTLVQVTEADSGMECLNLIQKNHYDLIFLDHMMPDMDGVETLRRLKAMSGCPCEDTPVIVLTANAVSGAKETYLSQGFDDFLSKPIVPDKLENMIVKMLPDRLLEEAAADSQGAAPSEEPRSLENSLDALPQIDGLDWQYARMHLPDMELLGYTVREFYSQIDFSADRLEQFYSQIAEPGQMEQYRIQVHAMKGLAATVGILPLFGVAKLLESAAKDGNIEVVLSVTPIFLREWRSYREKLQGVFGIEAVAAKEVTDSSVILALVEMVRFSMREMDIDEADRLMAKLQGYEYSEEIRQTMRKLAETVTSLDADGTEDCAALLTKQLESLDKS